MKQQRINTFLLDLADFIEKYYSEGVNEVQCEKVEDWVKVIVSGDNDSVFELWSSGTEITVIFSESHWHIDDYNDPCDMNEIYSQTLHSVLDILDGEVVTYSCWQGERCKGGGAFNSVEDNAIEKAQKGFGKVDLIKIKRWGCLVEIVKNIHSHS